MKKKIEQFQCKSYFEDGKVLDCTCGKCDRPKKVTKKKGKSSEYAYMEAVIKPIAKKIKKFNIDQEWEDISIPILKKITEDFTTKEPCMNCKESNTWRYIALSIFLCVIGAMIINTPYIINEALKVCK
jgi:hypothetical protein